MMLHAALVALLAAAESTFALPRAAFVPSSRVTFESKKAVRSIPGLDDGLVATSGEYPHDVMEHAVEELKKTIADTISSEKLAKMGIVDVAESTVQMVENAVDFVAEKKAAAEKKLAAAHAVTLDALEERKGYVYMKYKAKADAKAADDRTAAVESFDTVSDDMERRRDMAVAHAAHHLRDDATHLLYHNKAELRKDVKREKEILEELGQLKKNHAELETVLKELRSIIDSKSVEPAHYEYDALDEFGKEPLHGQPMNTEHYEYAMLDEFGPKPLERQAVKAHEQVKHFDFELMDEFGGY